MFSKHVCSRAEPFGVCPPSSALAPLQRTWIIVFGAHLLSWFTDAKTHSKWMTLTISWSWACSSQTYWCLRIDNVNPCDMTIGQSENCAWADHLHCDRPPPPPPCLSFLKCFKILVRGVRAFGGSHPSSFMACNPPFSAPNSDTSDCLASLCIGHTTLH